MSESKEPTERQRIKMALRMEQIGKSLIKIAEQLEEGDLPTDIAALLMMTKIDDARHLAMDIIKDHAPDSLKEKMEQELKNDRK